MQGRMRAKTGGIPIPPTQTQARQDALLPARGMLRILASRERRRWAAYRSPLRECGARGPLNELNLIAVRRIDEDKTTAG